jgi:YHS domain-containing protein
MIVQNICFDLFFHLNLCGHRRIGVAANPQLKECYMETDPVCEMPVESDTAEFKVEYRGKEYYFCSAGCYDKFKRDQKEYV